MNRISQYISEGGKSEDGIFKGFPYLVTRIATGVLHVILLPGEVPLSKLFEFARQQTMANKLPACLALAPYHGAYLLPYRTDMAIHTPPPLPVLVTNKLKPCLDFSKSEEFIRREKQLEEYEQLHPYFEDLIDEIGTKGGRDATLFERIQLEGCYPNNIPRGLERCGECHLENGECLDPCTNFEGKIMRVDCLCSNDNLCAVCGRKLYSYKLNANFYNEGDGHIWHVPGSCAFEHQC